MAKVVAAFIGGMVVALGGALMYVHSTDLPVAPPSVPSAQPPAASTPTPTPAAKPDPSPAAATGTDTAVETHSLSTERKANHTVLQARHVKTHPARPKLVEIAQNSPVAPAPDPAPIQTQTELPNAPQSQPDAPAIATSQPAQVETPPPPPPPQPHVVTLAAGTMLDIRLGETLSTDHNYTGDTFRASLQTPIIMDGFIIADRGSKVLGKIINAQKPGRVQGTADLSLALTQINTTDGQQIQITTDSYDRRGASNSRSEAEKIGGGAALGAIIGAIGGGGKGAAIGAGVGGAAGTGAVLLSHGHSATIPSETRLQFRLATPVTITEKLN